MNGSKATLPLMLATLLGCSNDTQPGTGDASGGTGSGAVGGASGAPNAGAGGAMAGQGGSGAGGESSHGGTGGAGGGNGKVYPTDFCENALFKNGCSDGSVDYHHCSHLVGRLLKVAEQCYVAPFLVICSDMAPPYGEASACYSVPRADGTTDVLVTTNVYGVSAEMKELGIVQIQCPPGPAITKPCP